MGRESLVFRSRIMGHKGRGIGQSHQAIDMRWWPQLYDTQHAHSAKMADDLCKKRLSDVDRNLVLVVSSWPPPLPRLRLSVPPLRDWTDLTLVQVSWPCGGRWNEIFLSSSLSAEENQWALYSVGTVESILSPKKNPAPVPSVSICQHSQTSQPALCGQSWTRITQSMCPALDNTQKPTARVTLPTFLTLYPRRCIGLDVSSLQLLIFLQMLLTRTHFWHGCILCSTTARLS